MSRDQKFSQAQFERLLLIGHFTTARVLVETRNQDTNNLLQLTNAFLMRHTVLRQPGARQVLDFFLYPIMCDYPAQQKIKDVFFVRALYPASPTLRRFYVSHADRLCNSSRRYDLKPWICLVLEVIAGRYCCRHPGPVDPTLRRTKERARHLVWSVEGGLTTYTPVSMLLRISPPPWDRLPFSMCVKHGLLPEARLMYGSGAVSAQELRHHGKHLAGKARPLTQMDDFLHQVTAESIPLQNMCPASLSKHVGCGADRKGKLLRIGLPSALVRRALFEDHIEEYNDAVNKILGQEAVGGSR